MQPDGRVGHIRHRLQETRAAPAARRAAHQAQPTATPSGAQQRARRGTQKNLAKALAVSNPRGQHKRSSAESSTRHGKRALFVELNIGLAAETSRQGIQSGAQAKAQHRSGHSRQLERAQCTQGRQQKLDGIQSQSCTRGVEGGQERKLLMLSSNTELQR